MLLWRIFVMIRKLLNRDIDRVADIWLKTNLKAHYFISNQYWKSNYELVKEMLSQSEVYVFEADKMIQGFVGLNDEYMLRLNSSAISVIIKISPSFQKRMLEIFRLAYSCSNQSLYRELRFLHSYIGDVWFWQ